MQVSTMIAGWGIFNGVVLIYLYCYIAERVSYRLTNIGDIAHNMNWLNFPFASRKHLLLIIQQAQIPFHFSGLKLIDCNLPTFAKVS